MAALWEFAKLLSRQFSIISPRVALAAISLSELRDWQTYFQSNLSTHDLLVYDLAGKGLLPNCYSRSNPMDDEQLEDVMSEYATYSWRPDERSSG